MIDSGTEPGWLSVAEASRALSISETAVRKRIRAGTIPVRDRGGRKEVHIKVEDSNAISSQPQSSTEIGQWSELEAARLAGELSELRARLEDLQCDRDRWHQLAMETREEARALAAERTALEREIRLLLTRT